MAINEIELKARRGGTGRGRMHHEEQIERPSNWKREWEKVNHERSERRAGERDPDDLRSLLKDLFG